MGTVHALADDNGIATIDVARQHNNYDRPNKYGSKCKETFCNGTSFAETKRTRDSAPAQPRCGRGRHRLLRTGVFCRRSSAVGGSTLSVDQRCRWSNKEVGLR